MRDTHIPSLGVRYWVAISLASVFGCNCGDFASHVLGLGHWHGLLPLAVLLAALLWAERRTERGGEAWYWAAIIILRTAATNLADFGTHDLALPYPWVIVLLETLLVLVVLPIPVRLPGAGGAKPAAGGWYWASMLTAGTLGTAIGDCVAEEFGLGAGYATLALGAALLLVLAAGVPGGWRGKAAYWWAIVAVRAAGTTAGDFVAFRHGVGLGLPLSTAITGAVFVCLLMLWRGGVPHRGPAFAAR
jgi:uncharacterized membrane-anchored protein